jgi:hypothetical protein
MYITYAFVHEPILFIYGSLTMLSVAWTAQHQMLGWTVMNELARMWKKAAMT